MQFPDPDSPAGRPSNLILARSDQYADALAGSVLAKNAPLLLTPSNALDPAVRAEIVRVLGPATSGHPTVTLLGGTQALSPGIDAQLGTTLSGPAGYTASINPGGIPQ